MSTEANDSFLLGRLEKFVFNFQNTCTQSKELKITRHLLDSFTK